MSTKIEWCDISINPVKGYCPNKDCPLFLKGCYAHNLYNRFKWNKEIRFDEGGFVSPLTLPHKKVFVGSTMELFGEWIKDEWLERIFEHCVENSDLTYIFLTKRPENLIKWSPFPENCYIGVSACNTEMALEAWQGLSDIEATIKFISFEPLQEEILMRDFTVIDWIIIGQQTPVRKSTMPKYEWIEDIVKVADLKNIPVFIKDNLNSCEISDYPTLLDAKGNLRQEFPNEQKD